MIKTKVSLFVLLLSLSVLWINAQEKAPVAVSPANDVGIARVAQLCPTFSWTAVEGAVAYRVEVYMDLGNAELSHEEMAARSFPVLIKEIQGAALSWTPSSDEHLSNTGVYAWYVQAIDAYGNGAWSQGKMFGVEVGAGFTAIEETVSETLEEHGVSKNIISDVLDDIRTEIETGGSSQAEAADDATPIRVQGNETGSNTYYGESAGFSLTTGIQNSFFGYRTGYGNTEGFSNTFIGYNAGYSNTTGSTNTFLGNVSGMLNTTGNNNTFIGNGTGQSNSTGYSNTFIGSNAGADNTGSRNTFVGHYAGLSNTTASFNTFIGQNTGYSNTTGGSNTFIGYRAGYSNITGIFNTFIGYDAGYSNTGVYNTFIGYRAGYSNIDATANTFIGIRAGNSNTTGGANTFIGLDAGNNNTTGTSNTFLGLQAGYYNTNGNNNVFLGNRAGFNNTGIRNVFIGFSAGDNNATGDSNVFLGYRAGYNETGSNKLYIENSITSDPLIYGEFDNDLVGINGWFGVGTEAPSRPMHLQTTGLNGCFLLERTDGATNYMNATASFGNFGTVTNHPLGLTVNSLHRMVLWADNSVTLQNGASCTSGGVWTDASSRELKENINALTTEQALDALEGLQPVTYKYKADKEDEHVGFIAEDVPDLVASKDRKGMSPMDVVAVLTKVLQEQQKTIDVLRKEVSELKAQVKQDK
jgi:hypothetical protein